MNKNHFMIPYSGNKRTEVKKILESVNLDDIKYIVEPFCGTSAFSYYVWKEHPDGKKYTYIINDNDPNLIELYKIAKDDSKWKELIKSANDACCIEGRFKISKEEYLNIINDGTLRGWFIAHKWYNIRTGMYPSKNIPKMLSDDYCDGFREFLKTAQIKFSNADGVDVVQKYELKKKAFIFLDPPYINLDNSFYECGGKNIYEYLAYKKSDDFNCYICAVLNDSWINRLIFKQYKIIEYNKMYQTSKKKVIHLLITNRN